jgi:hypothetical protein
VHNPANNNRVLSVQEIHIFSPTAVNEARFGYNFIRTQEKNQESIRDSDLGIHRPTANVFPGLPLILLAREAGGAQIGSPYITVESVSPSLSLTDILSLQRGRHSLRMGGEFRALEWSGRGDAFYGEIDFPTFNDFLTGNGDFSALSTGIPQRKFRSTDYNFFVQDDWKVRPRFTLNLGLRCELDLPPYDTKGRVGGFDPALYRPRLETQDGLPVGPPMGGIVQAGNPIPQYDLPRCPRSASGCSRASTRTTSARALASPGRLLIRDAWRCAAATASSTRARGSSLLVSISSRLPSSSPLFPPDKPSRTPFRTAVPEGQFPIIQPGVPLSGMILDRNNRTPYFHHFNASIQYELVKDFSLQVAYVGTRGLKLFRQVAFNQARIASLGHPIVNEVTGEVITANTEDNVPLRAPFQGALTGGFLTFNQTSGESTYHSLQVTLTKRLSHGLQFLGSYTLAKSIDNASHPGGGAFADGTLDTGGGLDTSDVVGNQLDGRANRGVSDFDRTHRFVANYVWDLPMPRFGGSSRAGRVFLGNWQASGIVIAMSGLPVDIVDPAGGSLYGLTGARPNWAPGADRATAASNIPPGYYFNPFAFAMAAVQPGQPIPSAHDSAHDPTALAGGVGTDIGNVGRNMLRGPSQSNVDFSLLKRFSIREARTVEFRADFFNVSDHANRNNPISDISVVTVTGGSVDPVTGRVLSPGDFGRIVGFSSSPRIIQLSLKFNF